MTVEKKPCLVCHRSGYTHSQKTCEYCDGEGWVYEKKDNKFKGVIITDDPIKEEENKINEEFFNDENNYKKGNILSDSINPIIKKKSGRPKGSKNR